MRRTRLFTTISWETSMAMMGASMGASMSMGVREGGMVTQEGRFLPLARRGGRR